MNVNLSPNTKMAMYTVGAFEEPPQIESVARVLGVTPDDVDASFGVVPINPAKGIYCVQADSQKVRPAFGQDGPYEGPWSSPNIETMG